MYTKRLIRSVIPILFLIACKVTFITGYDIVIDHTATKIKRDFSVFSIKLKRAFNTNDQSKDQDIKNFQDFYDNMEADLAILSERAIALPKRSEDVQKEIKGIAAAVNAFKQQHERGFKDIDSNAAIQDDHRDQFNAVISSFNALLKLQQELKASTK